MRYKVPQNIDMQDRIVGPLTILQFMYLLIGGAICYLFFQLFSFSIFVILALPVALFALALAFFKIQDQPFSKFIGASIQYFVKPKKLIWKRQIQKASVSQQPPTINSNNQLPITKQSQNPN